MMPPQPLLSFNGSCVVPHLFATKSRETRISGRTLAIQALHSNQPAVHHLSGGPRPASLALGTQPTNVGVIKRRSAGDRFLCGSPSRSHAACLRYNARRWGYGRWRSEVSSNRAIDELAAQLASRCRLTRPKSSPYTRLLAAQASGQPVLPLRDRPISRFRRRRC
jgi:hypothetical protein